MPVVNGIDTDTLTEDTFGGYVQGRTLILDGDGPCYAVAATVKRLDTAIRRFQQDVLKFMFLANAQDCRVHLTASGSDKFGRHRVLAAKPYQGNRKNKAKPALLEPLREAMADRSNWLEEFHHVTLHREREADDGMMMDAYELGDHGVTRSEDKDLRMTPYPYMDIESGRVMQGMPVGYLYLKTMNDGSRKCLGQGPLFFWAQLIMGDTADNIQGLDKLGAVAAYDMLGACTDIDTAANIVIDEYRRRDQNVVAEGWLLWLTRHQHDNVIHYLNERKLSEQNRAFVQDCITRPWVLPRKEEHGRHSDPE